MKLYTFIQNLTLVNPFFIFEVFSLVVNIAIEVIKAALLAVGIAIVGLLINIVKDTIVKPHSNTSLETNMHVFFRSIYSCIFFW